MRTDAKPTRTFLHTTPVLIDVGALLHDVELRLRQYHGKAADKHEFGIRQPHVGMVGNWYLTALTMETTKYKVNPINTYFYYSLYIEVVTPSLKLRCFPPAQALLVMRHTPYPFQHPVQHIQIRVLNHHPTTAICVQLEGQGTPEVVR